MGKILGNDHILKLAKAFFSVADASRIANPSFAGDDAWTMHDGAFYRQTIALRDADKKLVDAVLSKIGPAIAEERQVTNVAYGMVEESVPADRAKKFVMAIDSESTNPYLRIEPCFSVTLRGIDCLELGKVSVRNTSVLASEIVPKGVKWSIEANKPPSTQVVGSKIVVSLPQNCWRVEASGFKESIPSQAGWLIDVALSILRLSCDSKRRPSVIPATGEPEARATQPPRRDDHGLTLSKKSSSLGGSGLVLWYEISTKTFTKRQRGLLHQKCLDVMTAPAGTIGERICRGLGWLTRGRCATDQAERFIYFFTALEAVLSGDDDRAPVTDTIARNAASILTKNAETRGKVAKEFSRLYGIRSKLIHRGEGFYPIFTDG